MNLIKDTSVRRFIRRSTHIKTSAPGRRMRTTLPGQASSAGHHPAFPPPSYSEEFLNLLADNGHFPRTIRADGCRRPGSCQGPTHPGR